MFGRTISVIIIIITPTRMTYLCIPKSTVIIGGLHVACTNIKHNVLYTRIIGSERRANGVQKILSCENVR